jgi:hypothetical protein
MSYELREVVAAEASEKAVTSYELRVSSSGRSTQTR